MISSIFELTLARKATDCMVLSAKLTHRLRRMILAATAILPSVDHRIHDAPSKECEQPFENDSSTVFIENRCSGCISHVKEDFARQKTDRVLIGFRDAAQPSSIWEHSNGIGRIKRAALTLMEQLPIHVDLLILAVTFR
jgi:hypothetical protein